MVLGLGALVILTGGAAAPVLAAPAAAAGSATGATAVATAGTVSATAATTTGAVGSASAAMGSGGVAVAAAISPFGLVVLGASSGQPSPQDGGWRWDCWKPVLRDTSPEPSETGMLLKDVISDPRVRVVKAEGLPLAEGQVGAPDIVLENIWGEQFQVQFVTLGGSGHLAAHATRILSGA